MTLSRSEREDVIASFRYLLVSPDGDRAIRRAIEKVRSTSPNVQNGGTLAAVAVLSLTFVSIIMVAA